MEGRTVSEAVYAALDCGTNSTRLLIETGAGEVLVREMQITRLGQDVDSTGALNPEAIERTLTTLHAYRALMDEHGVDAGRLAATSAARDASNGREFLDQASQVTGVAAEILSGEEEAHLSYLGAMIGLEPAAGDDVVLDIGGGSTELVLSSGGQLAAHSMQVGCVRISERTLLSDPPSRGELSVARAMVDEALDRALDAIPALGALAPQSRMLGLAGTVSTLAQIDQELEHYERDRVHHYWLSMDRVRHWLEVLAAEPNARRAERPGMVKGREDVIVGGLVILVATLERLDLNGCLSSESDILDGMLASLREA
jgi:exopolyphosphatase/guanosine-5'-triphosphate,3'-diphosphate pyrophosphatase